MYTLTYLTIQSSFAKRTSTNLFTPTVEYARTFTTFSHAQTLWTSVGSGLRFNMFDKTNTILRIYFVGIDKR